MPASLPRFLSDLFPLLYGACFLALLWQAFKVMGKGFRAEPRLGAAPSVRAPGPASGDRTGRITIHPELLDANGQLTRDDLLTVRFSGDNESPSVPGEGS
jgi:hypothetical protein